MWPGTIAGIVLVFGGAAVVSLGSALVKLRMVRSFSELASGDREGLRYAIANTPLGSLNLPLWKKVVLVLSPAVVLNLTDVALQRFHASFHFGLIVYPVLIPIVLICRSLLVRTELQRLIWRKLAGQGVLVCLRCGYDLRGQVDCRCPECGTLFDPRRKAIRKGARYWVDMWRPPER